jgi:hypothetical protein
MSALELQIAVFAVAVLLAIPLVTGRLGSCAIRAMGTRQYRVAALAAAGMAFFAFLLLGVLAWWFMLGVSHRQKDIGDIYWVMAVTGLPYFLAAIGLWHFAGALRSRLASGVAGPSMPAQRHAVAGGPRRVAAMSLAVLVFLLAAALVAAALFLPLMLLAGPGSRMLPLPLAVLVWLAGIGLWILVPAWLARFVYRWLAAAGPSA